MRFLRFGFFVLRKKKKKIQKRKKFIRENLSLELIDQKNLRNLQFFFLKHDKFILINRFYITFFFFFFFFKILTLCRVIMKYRDYSDLIITRIYNVFITRALQIFSFPFNATCNNLQGDRIKFKFQRKFVIRSEIESKRIFDHIISRWNYLVQLSLSWTKLISLYIFDQREQKILFREKRSI